jgi:hypothetical protein
MQAVDPKILCDVEQYLPVNVDDEKTMLDHQRVQLRKTAEKKVDVLLRKLIGKTLTHNLVCANGEVLQEAGFQINEYPYSLDPFLVQHESEIMVDGHTDEEFISILKKVNILRKEYDQWKKEHGIEEE